MNPVSAINSTIRAAYSLAFECNPIILTDGISDVMGGFMPISLLTQAGGIPLKPSEFWAQYRIQAGTTLLSFSTGEYPFYNAVTAANTQMRNSDIIEFLMITPNRNGGELELQLARMTVLRQTLEKHQKKGGTFLLLTPSKIYENALFENASMVSYEEEMQLQMGWILSFRVPLIDTEDAATIYNDSMRKLAGQLPLVEPTFFETLFSSIL